ncbi:MAG: glycosyltransferase [Verrucomicrobia bacterium]|nr:glycosyltransferase [Verrucomicrobiota bacterium]
MKRAPMILIKLKGGLGNQMFQYALGRSLSLQRKAPLALDAVTGFRGDFYQRTYALDPFAVQARVLSLEELMEFYNQLSQRQREEAGRPYWQRSLVVEPTEMEFRHDARVQEAPPVACFDGYWQNEKYFTPHAELIRREFDLKPSAWSPAGKEWQKRIVAANAVAIHCRRLHGVSADGNSTNAHAISFHGACTLDYYQKAIVHICERLQAPEFFVFADDPAWAREHLHVPGPVHFISGDAPLRDYEELRLMSLCRHHVIANSTFSWWAAWLAGHKDQIVIAPTKWLNSAKLDTAGVCPASWLRLSGEPDPTAVKPAAAPKPHRPAVSVVIPCFKQAHFLPEAVESVVRQTFKDWEVIVVNDGSPDNTRAVFHQMRKRWPAAHLYYIEKPNGGLAEARNTGISAARGRYILPLDADDRIEPAYLEKTVRVLDGNPAVAIAYTDARFFGATDKLHIVGDLEFPKLLEVNQINYCSLYRRGAWEQVGGYNPNMLWGYEDWDLWIGCVERGLRAHHVREPLFCYRVKEGSMITHALKHDRELRSQIVMNHPKLFSPQAKEDASKVLAEAAAARMVSTLPDTSDAVSKTEPYLEEAQAAFDRGDLAAACNALREAVAVAPYPIIILQALGSLLFRSNHLEEASATFDRALTLAPQDVALLMQKAVTALKLGDVAAFEKALGRALELDPRNREARRLLARLNIEAGRYLDAAKGFVELADELPDDVEIWLALGTCLAKLNDTDNARTAFQRVLELAPDNVLARENLDALATNPATPAAGTQPANDSDPVLSVVITTYNRPDLLARCLAGFESQSLEPSQFEIIVVDDGSETPAEAVVSKFAGKLRVNYRYQANSGLAAARNAGIALARGTIIVPYDDDDVPHTDCLREHLEFHRRHPAVEDAMLANLEWLPGMEVTPLMHYVTEVDPRLWCLKGLKPGQQLPFGYLWGGCSSYKKELIQRAGGFDTRFRFGYEDTEAELRMRRHGLRVWWHPAARNLVANGVTYETFCRRCYRQGRSLRVFLQMYPGDPQVKAYSDITDAHEIVARTEPVIRSQQPLIASLLNAGWSLPEKSSDAKKESLELLHQLLFLSFEYWKNKGILDSAIEPSPTAAGAVHRVLVIAPELPAHDRASGAFRLFHLVKLLREAGNQVTFLARAAAGGLDPKPYINDLLALGVEVIPCDPDKIEARWGMKVNSPRVDLKRLFAERRFDVAYIYFYEVAEQYADEIRAISPKTKIVVDSVDIHFLREERRAELEKNPQLAAQAKITRERELAVYGKADLALTVTDADANTLRKVLPRANIGVLPNVHPVPSKPTTFDQRRDLLFVGGFQHHPNVDAMLHFVREIWPQVAKRLSDAKLFIVGDRPPQEIQQLAGDRIVVTGFVPSVEPYLSRCRVSVAPLRYGAGMKGKIGEAAAAGLPVVSSSIGVEGMGLCDNQQALVADTPKAFAEAIVRLYQDATLWQRLSEAGREFILSRYSPAVVGKTFNSMLDELSPRSSGDASAQDEKPDFSIIIPTLNNLALTKQCLQAIRETAAPCQYEIIVVDNGSTDGSAAFFAEGEKLGRLRVVTNKPGRNYSASNNQGAALARGKYLVFLNNDTKPLTGWLQALRETFEADPAVGVQGGKLLYPNGTIQHAGIVYGQIHPQVRQHYHIYLCRKADDPCVNRAREFQMVTGAMLAMRRELFERVGGFDNAYEFGHEDLDLCLAARAAGSKVWFNPKSVAYHFESMTKKQVGLEKFELKHDQPDSMDYKNRQRFMQKWAHQLRCDADDYYQQDGEQSPFAARNAAVAQPAGKKQHVLFTMYGWADEGGGTILPRQIAKALVQRGHRVSVICAAAQPKPGKPAYHVEESTDDGVKLYAIYNRPALFYDADHPEREMDDPEMRRVFRRLVDKLKPDIAHYHSLLNFSLGMVDELHRAGVPAVYTSHNYWPICPRMYLFKERLELCPGPSEDGSRCAACVGQNGRAGDFARRLQRGREAFREQVGRHLAVSHRVRELFIRSGHAADRIQVLQQQPQTVEALWSEVGSKRKIIGQLDRPLRVGFIGSLYPQKGVHVLIQALQAFQPGEVEAHCFGNVPVEYGELLKKFDQKHLARFHGAYEPGQLPRLLADMDVMVVPSVWEDCAPLVVAEALAARCPAIGSRIGGIPDFIEDGVTGFLFRAGDPAELASVLRRFIADTALLGRLQANIHPPKGFGRYLDELEQHYREVIAESDKKTSVTVVWEGSQFVHHSLALINRELCLNLIEAGHEVSILPYEPDQFSPEADGRFAPLAQRVCKPLSRGPDVHVRHQWPFNPQRPPKGKWVVIQPWEFGCVPKAWVPVLRDQVDELWVPSEFVRDCYVKSGVPAGKVVVVPNGIAEDKFRPDLTPLTLPTRKTFKFLFVGGTIHRKGPDVLLKAYLDAFRASDDVCLVIKDFGGKSVYSGQTLESQIKQAQAQPDAPEIVYLNSELSPEDLPRLYAACDCLVHPYRGEGFGLPVLEAMACGLPVIVTAGGSTDGFVTDDYGYKIPAQRRSIGRKVGDIELAGEGWLLEPDDRALAERMKWVVSHRAEAKQMGRKASDHVRREWTWSRVAAIAGERLVKLAAEKPRTTTALAQPLPAVAKLGDLAEAKELQRQKQYLPAWNAALAAIQIRPFHPEAFLLLAEVARAAGDVNQARRCAQRAHDMVPDWKPARKLLKSLTGTSRAATATWPAAPEASSSPRLSVCVIARNEEKFLAQCLASVRDLAYQIVVVDTGSTDRTAEIAREHGAEVHSFAWCDDFSAARNAAHEHVTGDWVLILDADEVLAPDSREQLLKEMRVPNAIAYRIPIVNVGEEREGCCYVPRLFRNAPGLFFVGRVHEQIFTSVEARRKDWGLENALGKTTLIHHGYTKAVIKDRRKVERNLRLLEQAIAEVPNEPSLLMNYGLDLVNDGQLDAGLEKYAEALRLMSAQSAQATTPEVRERLLTLYSSHLIRARRFADVATVLQSPVARAHGLTATLHFNSGLSCIELGRFDEAAEHMRQCLAKRDKSTLTPAAKEVRRGGPQHCLAICLVNQKKPAAAEEQFLAALAEDPASKPIRFDFARFLASANRRVEALKQLHALVEEHADDATLWHFGGQIALSQPEFAEFAADWTGEAVKHLPQDPAVLLQRAEALLLNNNASEALAALEPVNGAATPAHEAVRILCGVLCDRLCRPLFVADESQVSQEFLKRYRWLVAMGASSVIFQLNERIARLRDVLPGAARILGSVMEEAGLAAGR